MILNSSNLPKLSVDDFLDILYKRREECFQSIHNSPNTKQEELARNDYMIYNAIIQLAHRLERSDD